MNIDKTIGELMNRVRIGYFYSASGGICERRNQESVMEDWYGKADDVAKDIEAKLREVLQCKACPVTLEGYSLSNEPVQIQEPGQSTQEQQAQAWRAVWEVLQEVKPGFDDCYPLSGQEAAIKTIRELTAAQQGVQPVAGQSRMFGGEWGSCSVEHVAMVLAAPNEWKDYEARYLYTHPTQQGLDAPFSASGIAPCPLCGSESKHVKSGEGSGHRILCWNDDCECSSGYFSSKEDAIASWNSRAALAAQAKQGEQANG